MGILPYIFRYGAKYTSDFEASYTDLSYECSRMFFSLGLYKSCKVVYGTLEIQSQPFR
jgi:hypothetical protein